MAILRYKIMYSKATGQPIHANQDTSKGNQKWGKLETADNPAFGFCFADLETPINIPRLRSRYLVKSGNLTLQNEADWEETKSAINAVQELKELVVTDFVLQLNPILKEPHMRLERITAIKAEVERREKAGIEIKLPEPPEKMEAK